MISSTKSTVSLNRLKGVPVRPPKHVGGRWKGIPHYVLVEAFHKKAISLGLGFSDFHATLARGGADLAASFVLPKLLYRHFIPSVGLVASNSGRQGLRFWIGGLTRGEPDLLRGSPVVSVSLIGDRYTTEFDPTVCAAQLFDQEIITGEDRPKSKLEFYLDRLDTTIDTLKGARLTSETVPVLLMRAAERRIMPGSRVVRVMERWDDLPDGDKTAYNLLRCFSFVAGMNPAMSQMEQNCQFFRLLTQGE